MLLQVQVSTRLDEIENGLRSFTAHRKSRNSSRFTTGMQRLLLPSSSLIEPTSEQNFEYTVQSPVQSGSDPGSDLNASDALTPPTVPLTPRLDVTGNSVGHVHGTLVLPVLKANV